MAKGCTNCTCVLLILTFNAYIMVEPITKPAYNQFCPGFNSAPFKIRIAVPIKPIITPKTCLLVEATLKTAKPKRMVFKGTKEFKIDATALSIAVSAMANKNAGKKDPKNPESAIHFH